MKIIIKSFKAIFLVFIAMLLFSGCFAEKLFNKVPENYTDGIEYDSDFPDDILELYDDIVVYEEDNKNGKIAITAGSADSIDSVRRFTKRFIRNNNILLLEEEDDSENYIAMFEFGGYMIHIEISEAEGEYVEELFKSIVTYEAEKLSEYELRVLYPTPTPSPTPKPTKKPTPTPFIGDKYLDVGSYALLATTDGNYETGDINFTIDNKTEGAIYSYSFYGFVENTSNKDFEYAFNGSYLEFRYADGTIDKYNVTYSESGNIILEDLKNDFDTYEFYNWNDAYQIYPSEDAFTALGSWYNISYEYPHCEAFSFFPNNKVIYYFSGMNGFMFGTYDYDGWELIIDLGDGPFGFNNAAHKGNALILDATYLDEPVILQRAGRAMLWRDYSLSETNSKDITKMDLVFGSDGSLDINMKTGEKPYFSNSANWTIEYPEGYLRIYDERDGFSMTFLYAISYSHLYLLSEDQKIFYILDGFG